MPDEVEFGNLLVLGEQSDGLIIDWEPFKEEVPADTRLPVAKIDSDPIFLSATVGAASGVIRPGPNARLSGQ